MEINPIYIKTITSRFHDRLDANKVRILHGNFFKTNWSDLVLNLPEPILVVGNPPWVTNSELGSLGSSNLPKKCNFRKYPGLDAITGKSNFDISEWMLIRILEALNGKTATMAMLCKTTVARKVLAHTWRNEIGLDSSHIYPINASEYFGVSVDACFLICRTSPLNHNYDCSLYKNIDQGKTMYAMGFRDGSLVARVDLYNQWKHLQGKEVYKWRSGIKHDCTKIMALKKEGRCYRNGFGEAVDIEDRFLFPMFKSSDLANRAKESPRHWMIVTQKTVGDETRAIKHLAPRTWNYLQKNAQYLDRRASSIYKKRPRFSIFGVGPYTFSPWKVAISGFYKKLEFKAIGNIAGKPIVLDDTCYFIPCKTGAEAEYLASLLNSRVADEFFRAFVFWDAKRPITMELLRRLDLRALARELGTEDHLTGYFSPPIPAQKNLFPASGQVTLSS